MEQTQTTTTTQSGASRREERLMASSISSTTIETEVRDFAREFPTPNVLRAVALCESGQLSWAEVNGVFQQSLADGLGAVA